MDTLEAIRTRRSIRQYLAKPVPRDLLQQVNAQKSVDYTEPAATIPQEGSSAVCSPTRYGLLTGRYNWRTRLQERVIAAYEPPLIAAGRPTLPGFLRRYGYHTACIGKWHLGWEWPGPQPSRMTEKHNGQAFLEWDFTKPIAGGPTQRGFDDYVHD